jgi:hypothetical protein
MKLIHACIGLSLAALVSASSVSAQQPAPPAGEHVRAKSPDPVTGEILAVDVNAKTIVIKTAPDTEMKFSYSEETEIVGGEKGPAGLATSTGTMVTVTYDVHGTANIAIKIEVKAKPKQ